MIKVCYILSYKDPRYVRTQFLVQTLEKMSGTVLFRAINSNKSILRYFQTLAKLVWIRITKRPDVYILGFRGLEIYWPVRLLTIGKPLIYDEFLNPYLWFVEEHKKFTKKSFLALFLQLYLKSVYKSASLILSDTEAHASYSIKNFSIDPNKSLALHVGADEEIFKQFETDNKKRNSEKFTVFFYGNFLPLHGLKYIIEAASLLKDQPYIKFLIIGGANRKNDMKNFQQELSRLGLKNIEHKSWVNFEELPEYIAAADLCLAGPFGNTPQSRRVITGKTYQFLAMAALSMVGATQDHTSFVDRKNCLLVDQGSGALIADNILWAYRNRSRLKSIARQGQQLYEKEFSQRAQTGKLRRALAKLV